MATNAPPFVNQFPWDTLAGQNGRATVGKAVAAFLKTIAFSSRYSTRTGTEVKRVSAPGKPPLTLAGSGIEGFALDPPVFVNIRNICFEILIESFERRVTPLFSAQGRMVVRSAIFLEDSYIMNKAELISAISAETQMTKTAVEKVINAYIRVVTDELAQGGVVNMSGFGNFSVADRAARTGRNPLTGEAVHIPARRAPRFTAGQALKDAVR